MSPLEVSERSRRIGLGLLLASVPLAARLVWEMTWVTWRQGPRLAGLGLANAMPAVVLLGLANLGSIVWCLWLIAAFAFRRRRLARLDWALLVGSAVITVAPFVPYPAWQWMTIQVLGLPAPDSPAGLAMFDALTSAARSNDTRLAGELLKRGLDVNGFDRSGETALYAAAHSGRAEMLVYLLRHGAQQNLANKAGEAPLHAAACLGDVPVARILIGAGADGRLKNGKGLIASELAHAAGYSHLSEFLETWAQPPLLRPFRQVETRWTGSTAIVTLSTQLSPALPYAPRPLPHLRSGIGSAGELLNLRGTGGDARYERWAIDLVGNWYCPSPEIVALAAQLEIEVRFRLSQ